MPQLSAPGKPIAFKGTQLGVVHVELQELEPHVLADALHMMLGGMADFFKGEPAILDLAQVRAWPERIDWSGVLSLLRRYQIQPVGVLNAPESYAEGIRRAGLALLDATQLAASVHAPASQPAPAPQIPVPPPPSLAPSAPTMVVEHLLRSGQQVYARGADLILLGGVRNGAEVIADGCIHCYGPMLGRAIAGASGDTKARILATYFGPELVSIAGVYRTFEQGIPEAVAGRAAQVRLEGEGNKQTLTIAPLRLD